MAVRHPHVDRTRHFLARWNILRRSGSAAASMPRDRATAYQIYRRANWQTLIKIGIWLINFFRPCIHPIFVEKNRGLRRFLYAGISGKKLLLFGIALFREYHVRIKPTVVAVDR